MRDERYASYLLRFRQAQRPGGPVWECSLESTRTGERLYFTLEGLLEFIQEQYGHKKEGENQEEVL